MGHEFFLSRKKESDYRGVFLFGGFNFIVEVFRGAMGVPNLGHRATFAGLGGQGNTAKPLIFYTNGTEWLGGVWS